MEGADCRDRGAPKGTKNHILIGSTGSVASIKIPDIVKLLKTRNENYEIRVVTTEAALHFYDHTTLGVEVFRDEDEWKAWQKKSDPVLHIELRRWADIFVIAPLDANTLSKIAHGLCDNLLTCVARAWDRKYPLLFAPAMNTLMWEHPVTPEHISKLKSWGYLEIPCVEKLLECGDRGMGGMAQVETVVEHIEEALSNSGNSSSS